MDHNLVMLQIAHPLGLGVTVKPGAHLGLSFRNCKLMVVP